MPEEFLLVEKGASGVQSCPARTAPDSGTSFLKYTGCLIAAELITNTPLHKIFIEHIYPELPHLFLSPISLSGMLTNPCCKIDSNFSRHSCKYLGQECGR